MVRSIGVRTNTVVFSVILFLFLVTMISSVYGIQLKEEVHPLFKNFESIDRTPRNFLNLFVAQEQLICQDYLYFQNLCGLVLTPISNKIGPNATYTFTTEVYNPSNELKKVDYNWYVCRCDESAGNPPGICTEFFPVKNSTHAYPPGTVEDCLHLGTFNLTLNPYEKKNISASTQQYKNLSCGSFQADLELIKVNNNACKNLVAAGVVRLCKDCSTLQCGNGILEPEFGEYCDDGNQIDNDQCSNSCELTDCGNGIKDENEQCDDGNSINNDSCNNQCKNNFCGDGIVNNGEQCDDGNQIDNDQCSNSCKFCISDKDKDGVCDNIDICPDSKPEEPVDEDGCDIFDFCRNRGLSCGFDCAQADWKNNEPDKKFPNDCTVVVPLKNGVESQPICVPTVSSNLCAN